LAYKRSTTGGNIRKETIKNNKKLDRLMAHIINNQSITRGKLAGLVSTVENVSTTKTIVTMRANNP